MLYYKATPKMTLEGIQKSGLDPSKAGGFGGATMLASVSSGREKTSLDKNKTWLGGYSQALSYAEDVFSSVDPVILQINYCGTVQSYGNSGYTCNETIPASQIEIESVKPKNFISILRYNGNNAYIHDFD
jgi:hypothetical protein